MHALMLGILLAATTHQGRILQPKQRAKVQAPRRNPFPAVELFAVNLRETLKYRPYDDKGKPRKNANKELTRLLRCWHTGRQHAVDARLGRVLYQVARHYPGRRIEVFSGFRPKKYCTRQHSRHLTASAIDFRIPGVKNESLIGWLRSSFHPLGVGYYPHGVHVHLDVDRAIDTYWIDADDAPSPGRNRPLAAIGDTAPSAIEATQDEPVEAAAPADPAVLDDPPLIDPAIPE
jgi:uncharacterized protein YcbK (DUF882 family)